MTKLKKITLVLITLLVVMIGGIFGYVYSKLNSIYVKDEATKKEEAVEGKVVDGITNILLVGVDGEMIDKGNRSDGTMVVTIDSINNEIKLTSIARDTLVNIPGYGNEKLTHAYAYEGIDLLKEVFKENFDLEIDKYVAVNFSSFMEIIDEIGGVVVEVPENGLDAINSMIDVCYQYYSEDDRENIQKIHLTKAGKQRLNGYQALAFSRIRYTDDAFHRDARHREVAEAAYEEFLTKGQEEYKKCADILLDNTKTNISPMEMMNLGFTALKIADKDIEQFQFPLEEHRTGGIVDKQTGWVLQWDKEPNLEAWHKFIYGE
ncbi:LCP family protein [Romboutsia sp.]|uniref:LCP family protein n=1 Tax=Romboutsia sp. TaxID=1965302 RepID=UPI003F3D054D